MQHSVQHTTVCVLRKKGDMSFKNIPPKVLERWHVEAGGSTSIRSWASKASETSLIWVKLHTLSAGKEAILRK